MFTKEGKKIGKPVKDSIRSKTKKGRTNSEYSNTQIWRNSLQKKKLVVSRI